MLVIIELTTPWMKPPDRSIIFFGNINIFPQINRNENLIWSAHFLDFFFFFVGWIKIRIIIIIITYSIFPSYLLDSLKWSCIKSVKPLKKCLFWWIKLSLLLLCFLNVFNKNVVKLKFQTVFLFNISSIGMHTRCKLSSCHQIICVGFK